MDAMQEWLRGSLDDWSEICAQQKSIIEQQALNLAASAARIAALEKALTEIARYGYRRRGMAPRLQNIARAAIAQPSRED